MDEVNEGSESSSTTSEEFEVHEGVAICRKYSIVIRNHARHDIETIRTMLQDLKSPDEATRKSARRPIWITGYSGVPRYDKGDPNKIIVSFGQNLDDPRDKLLMWHVENDINNVCLYIADEKDSSKVYYCGSYLFDGYAGGRRAGKSDEISGLVQKFNLSREETSILSFRKSFHHR